MLYTIPQKLDKKKLEINVANYLVTKTNKEPSNGRKAKEIQFRI